MNGQPDHPADDVPHAAPLTDSPWFWLMLFSCFALAGLIVLAPKYARRQGAIETRVENRKRALAWDGEQVTSPEVIEATRLPRPGENRPLQISLEPLFLGIGLLVTLAVMGLSARQLWHARVQAASGPAGRSARQDSPGSTADDPPG